jgi:hypothetical protein
MSPLFKINYMKADISFIKYMLHAVQDTSLAGQILMHGYIRFPAALGELYVCPSDAGWK